MDAARQTRCERSRKHRAKQPQQHAQPLAPKRPMAEQTIAPHCDRQQQRQRAEPQELHHQIGGDRAGPAEQIVNV